MSRILPTLAATTALALATFIVPALPAFAASPFDGTWIIDVPSDTINGGGDGVPVCPALRLQVQITNDQISGNFRRSYPEADNVVADGGRNVASMVTGIVQPDGAVAAQWQNFHAAGTMLGAHPGLTVDTECGPLRARMWRLDDETAAMTTASAGGGEIQAATAAATSSSDAYNVYFHFDKSNLTVKAQDVVTAAVSATQGGQAGRVALIGKADLAGTDPYNMALSQRRADTVRNALVAGGVPADRIDTRWDGDRNPPVPTAAGVRDAQNRVVEVAIH
jgi:outer membrane protein OmpA-like peptidoglycan-associated protein